MPVMKPKQTDFKPGPRRDSLLDDIRVERSSHTPPPHSVNVTRLPHRRPNKQTREKDNPKSVGSDDAHSATTTSSGSNDGSVEGSSRQLTLLTHKPQAPETLTIMRIEEAIAYEGATETWFDEIPARYGHEPCVDLAAQALALAGWYGRGLLGATRDKAFASLGIALSALRLKLRVG